MVDRQLALDQGTLDVLDAIGAGVTTSAGGSVQIEKCTVCGAPIELDDEGCCALCGAEVTLGTQDWVLSRMSAYQDVLPATDPSLVE